MRIFGIDPGSTRTGYGCVQSDGSRHRLVCFGSISAPAGSTFPVKLKAIHSGLVALIAEHRPDFIAIEDLFHAKNVRSALKLGHARGVAILAAVEADVPRLREIPRAGQSATNKMMRPTSGSAASEQRSAHAASVSERTWLNFCGGNLPGITMCASVKLKVVDNLVTLSIQNLSGNYGSASSFIFTSISFFNGAGGAEPPDVVEGPVSSMSGPFVAAPSRKSVYFFQSGASWPRVPCSSMGSSSSCSRSS